MSAEDLLRTSQVPELRRLVFDLDKEASSKKTELQLMVGSKYHDFIQSADSIRGMQEKAEEMQTKLGTFLHSSQRLVASTEELLARTKKVKPDNDALAAASICEAARHAAPQRVKIDSASVWTCLEQCDVSEAARLVGLAEFILFAKGKSASASSSGAGFDKLFPRSLLSDIAAVPVPPKVISHLRSAAFLAEIVRDDAHLFLLLKDAPVLELAENLAALGVLHECGRVALLDKLLAARDAQLQGEAECGKDAETLKSALASFVRILQRTILDVYMLFVRPVKDCDFAGLLGRSQRNFEATARSGLRETLLEFSPNAAEFEYSVAAVATTDLETQKLVRKHFDVWFAAAVERCASLTVRTLDAMHSAATVAALQQHVWIIAVYFKGRAPSTAEFEHSQDAWEAASLALLAPARRRKSDADAVAAHLLWTQALRQPFLQHVERLLRGSCLGVLDKFKSHVFGCLGSVGMHMDSATFVIEGTPNSSNTRPTVAPGSPLIFCQADAIRMTLERELDLVLWGAQSTENLDAGSHDPQASAALRRALHVQCAHLAGHLSVFLRSVAEALAQFLLVQGTKDPRRVNPNTAEAALYGLLLVGRIAWLIRARGGALEVCLAADNAAVSVSGLSYHLTSDEQLHSAFDIADSNGDGRLSYDEALDAILALAVGGDTTEQVALSQQLTPSVSFSELALLSAHLLQDAKPQERYFDCLVSVSETAHKHWVGVLMSRLQEQLRAGLLSEMGCTSASSTFMALWVSHTVELDVGQSEIVRLPASPSASLAVFLNGLNRRVNEALLSLDTVQQWNGTLQGGGARQTGLASRVTNTIYSSAAHAIAAAYDSLGATFEDTGAARTEQSLLQGLMDLRVASAALGRCSVAVQAVDESRRAWERMLDPINAQLMLPLLWTAADAASSQYYLLFPGNFSPAHAEAKQLSETALQGVFSSSRSSRFALLPLAVSTASSRPSQGVPRILTARGGADAGPKGRSETDFGKGLNQLKNLFGM